MNPGDWCQSGGTCFVAGNSTRVAVQGSDDLLVCTAGDSPYTSAPSQDAQILVDSIDKLKRVDDLNGTCILVLLIILGTFLIGILNTALMRIASALQHRNEIERIDNAKWEADESYIQRCVQWRVEHELKKRDGIVDDLPPRNEGEQL